MSKRLHFWLFVVFASLSLYSCDRAGEGLEVSSDLVGSVTLTASYSGDETSTRVSNDLWESSDFIGVTTSDEDEFNMCYMVENSGTMTNTNDDYTISVVGQKSYYAYYPYDSNLDSDGVKTIDLSDQSELSDEMFSELDLMWTKQENIGVYQSLVYLLFKRQLVHLDVTLCIKGGTYDETKGIALSGVELGGTLDVRSGELLSNGSSSMLDLRVKDSESYTFTKGDGEGVEITIVRAEAIVMPMSSRDIALYYYDKSGSRYVCTMTSGEWSGGNNYNYMVTNPGVESCYLSDFESGNLPSGTFWIVADSGVVSASEFSALKQTLAGTGVLEVEHNLIFPNLTILPSGALSDCLSLYSLSLPAVTTIGSSALSGCSNLRYFDAADVEYISTNALSGCDNLLSVGGMEQLYLLGDSAFAGCSSLGSITLPELSNLGGNAFEGCSSMTTFEAPQLSWVGSEALKGCDALDVVFVGNELTTSGVTHLEYGWVDHDRADDITLTISSTLPSGVTQSGTTISYASGDSDTFKSVENQAWQLSEFSSSNKPDDDVWIIMDKEATSSTDFAGLRDALGTDSDELSITLVFPYLESLPYSALTSANNITAIYLLNVESIGSYALSSIISLQELYLGTDGDGVSTLYNEWMSSTDSESVDLSIKIASTTNYTIEYNRMKDVSATEKYFNSINGVGFSLGSFNGIRYGSSSMPSTSTWTITDGGDPSAAEFEDLVYVLNNQVDEDITLVMSNVNSLPRMALDGAYNLSSISLPSATRLYHEALAGCYDLTHVDAPSVTTISNSAFSNCVNLNTVSLPSAMVVGSSLFYKSDKMESLTLGSATYIVSYDSYCFDTMYNMDGITLTICSQSEITDQDITISDNSITFVTDDKYDPFVTHTFKQIIQQ